MPPWHVGHVIKKLMLAAQPKEITRTELAERSGKRPMTITHLLKGGKYDDGTIEAVCRVLGVTKAELYAEVERSNARGSNVVSMHPAEQKRRLSDRDQHEIDADQYARRLLRLANSAQTAIYNAIRAFEEAYGLLKNSSNR
jgi:transcriptional regulator with XRE-family HTH domain